MGAMGEIETVHGFERKTKVKEAKQMQAPWTLLILISEIRWPYLTFTLNDGNLRGMVPKVWREISNHLSLKDGFGQKSKG